MKVVVTGGGTGGHILPVLAVIKSLNKIDRDTKIFFIGSRFGIESKLIPKMSVKYYGISAGKFRRYHKSKILNLIDPTTIFLNVRDLFRFVKGIRESYRILSFEKPDVLFAKGGYVSLPVGIAAWILKIPTVIHESDTVMGLSNAQMAKFARKVCVSFPKKYFPQVKEDKIIETGNPIREDIKGVIRGEAIRRLGLEHNKKTILIMGGSQGSLFINNLILEVLDKVLLFWQVIWVVGERDLMLVKERTKKIDSEKRKALKIFGFVTNEIAELYGASDLVITRAGSNALFELAELEKPTITIPIENMAGGHQLENAKYFSRKGATFVMKQSSLTGAKLYHQIQYLIEDEGNLRELATNIKSLARPNAAYSVADIVYKTGVERFEQTRENQKKR